MVTENSDNTDEVVEETAKKSKAKKPKYDAIQELPDYDLDLKQYVFEVGIVGTEEVKQVVASSENVAASLLDLPRNRIIIGSQVDYEG